jgi:hypothetical protein
MRARGVRRLRHGIVLRRRGTRLQRQVAISSVPIT